jgi:hypothetical protein
LYEKLLVIVGQALLLALRVGMMVANAVNKDGRLLAYNLVGIFQVFLALIVNIGTTDWTRDPKGYLGGRLPKFKVTGKPLDPERAAIHGLVQYFLGTIGYNIYTGQPLISPLP